MINQLNSPTILEYGGRLPRSRSADLEFPFYDVNGDGFCTANDALQIVNYLNKSLGEGEFVVGGFWPPTSSTSQQSQNRTLVRCKPESSPTIQSLPGGLSPQHSSRMNDESAKTSVVESDLNCWILSKKQSMGLPWTSRCSGESLRKTNDYQPHA